MDQVHLIRIEAASESLAELLPYQSLFTYRFFCALKFYCFPSIFYTI